MDRRVFLKMLGAGAVAGPAVVSAALQQKPRPNGRLYDLSGKIIDRDSSAYKLYFSKNGELPGNMVMTDDRVIGFCPHGISPNHYGWIQICGPVNANTIGGV